MGSAALSFPLQTTFNWGKKIKIKPPAAPAGALKTPGDVKQGL